MITTDECTEIIARYEKTIRLLEEKVAAQKNIIEDLTFAVACREWIISEQIRTAE